jgi:hypothetical protein
VGFYFEFWIPPGPLVLPPETVEDDPWGAPEPPVPLAREAPPPPDEPLDPGEPPPAAPDVTAAVALELPPLADAVNFPVEDRGFFAGPQTALQFDLLDRASGRLLWTKAVSSDADPLDAAAVAKLVDGALAGQSWSRPSR